MNSDEKLEIFGGLVDRLCELQWDIEQASDMLRIAVEGIAYIAEDSGISTKRVEAGTDQVRAALREVVEICEQARAARERGR